MPESPSLPCAESANSFTLNDVELRCARAEALVLQLQEEKQRLISELAEKDAEIEALQARLAVYRRGVKRIEGLTRKLTD